MSVLMKEEFTLLRSEYNCQTLVIKSTETGLVMEVVSVGGELYLVDLFSNPEKRFIKKIKTILEKNKGELGFEFEEMKI